MGASFTTRNMGVWALATGAATAGWHAYPNAEIKFLDYNYESAHFKIKHHGEIGTVELINIRFSKKFWLPHNIARLLLTAFLIRNIPFKLLRETLYNQNFWLRTIKSSDIIGSIAGGDSFSDIYGYRRLIYVSLPQILIILIGKPLFLLPQTIGPFNSILGKAIARFILRRADRIFSRDKEGLDKISKLVGSKCQPLRFCYDLGFVLEPNISKEKIPDWFSGIDPGTSVIGVNVSGLLYIGGYTRKNMFGLKSDYKKMIENLIKNFVSNHNAFVILFPHVLGEYKHRESDVIACEKIFKEIAADTYERLQFIQNGFDHQELKALISRCDFFIGSRMHACIAALSQCIPALGLAYSRKFRGVFESVDVEDLVLDLRQHNEKSIITLSNSIYQRRDEFRARLKNKMPTVKATVLSLFDGYLNDSSSKGTIGD